MKSIQKDYIRLLEDAPDEYVEVIQSAIQMAEEKMEGKLGGADFLFPFWTILIFAIKRQEQGNCSSKSDALGNSEILSRRISGGGGNALREINEKLNVALPEAEIGNIAFHLVNAQIHGKEEGGAETEF